MQEELRHKVGECKRISAQLKDFSETSASGSSADNCLEGRDSCTDACGQESEMDKMAHLEAALEKERAETEFIQRELCAANATVAQLQVSNEGVHFVCQLFWKL